MPLPIPSFGIVLSEPGAERGQVFARQLPHRVFNFLKTPHTISLESRIRHPAAPR